MDFTASGFHEAALDNVEVRDGVLALALMFPCEGRELSVSVRFEGVEVTCLQEGVALDAIGSGAEGGEVLDLSVKGLSAELLVEWARYSEPRRRWTESLEFSFSSMTVQAMG